MDDPPDVVPNLIRLWEHIHLRQRQLLDADIAYCGLTLTRGLCARHPHDVPPRDQRYICLVCLRNYRPIIPFDDPGSLAALEW